MKKQAFFTLFALSLLGPAHSDPVTKLGPAELLYTDAQLPADVTGEFGIDGTFATVKKDEASFYSFNSHWWGMSRYTGTAARPFPATGPDAGFPRCREALFPNDPFLHSGRTLAFIPSIYKAPNGHYLGFVHLEDGTSCPNIPPTYEDGNNCPQIAPVLADFYCGTQTYSIGLAYSQNEGQTWKFLGTVVHPNIRPGKNIGGVPFLVVNGYFYIYFNEWAVVGGSEQTFIGMARAPVQDVLNAALNNTVTPWMKFNGGNMANDGFNESGLTGTATNVVQVHPSYPLRNDIENYDVHSDAVYSRAVNRYYLLVNIIGRANLLYSSTTGTFWENPIVVDNTVMHPNFPNQVVHHAYPTITAYSFGTDDLREVGREFYVQYTLKPTQQFGYDDLYRKKVSTTSDIVPMLRFW